MSDEEKEAEIWLKQFVFRYISLFLLLMLMIVLLGVAAEVFIGDDDEADHTGDAVITEEEAVAIAEENTGGTAISVELENEDGYLVYGVHIEKDSKNYDVKVDAGTGEVLKVEDD